MATISRLNAVKWSYRADLALTFETLAWMGVEASSAGNGEQQPETQSMFPDLIQAEPAEEDVVGRVRRGVSVLRRLPVELRYDIYRCLFATIDRPEERAVATAWGRDSSVDRVISVDGSAFPPRSYMTVRK